MEWLIILGRYLGHAVGITNLPPPLAESEEMAHLAHASARLEYASAKIHTNVRMEIAALERKLMNGRTRHR